MLALRVHSKILALRFRKEKIDVRECAKAFADSWRRLRVREEASRIREEASRIREEASRIREDALRIREDALRFCKGLCGCVKYQEGSSLRMRKDNSTLRIRKEKISTLRMRKVKICLWLQSLPPPINTSYCIAPVSQSTSSILRWRASQRTEVTT